MAKRFMVLAAAAFVLAAVTAKAEASSAGTVTVWENVWESAGSVQLAQGSQVVPSYDDTQWTIVGPGSGSGSTCVTNGDCDDNNACTIDTCSTDNLPQVQNVNPEPLGCTHTPVVCTDGNSCTTDSCDPMTGCTYPPLPDTTPCDDGDACTDNTACNDGACLGGSQIVCNDSDNCTTDSCNSQSGCVFTVAQESASCGTCDDGEDNDGDDDIDGEDCGCSTLCEQQRFAVVTTFVPSKFTRYALYLGSDVSVLDSATPLPYPSGGICQTNGDYRAGANVGLVAATGSSRFGKGVVGDQDLQGEDVDTGSTRVTLVRNTYDSDGDPIITQSALPYVGFGACSNNPMTTCLMDGDCGMGNTCDNQLTLDPNNPAVTTDGSTDTYNRCVNAQATVQPEADTIAAIAGTVQGLKLGNKDIKTTASAPLKEVIVGAGQQVIYAKTVRVAGQTTLRFKRDPMAVGDPTVLVIRVARTLRIGGLAKVELDGIDPANVVWSAEGSAGGRPKLLRACEFKGTLIAAQRRGILTGSGVTVDGALKGRKIHLGQNTVVNHTPFKALLQ